MGVEKRFCSLKFYLEPKGSELEGNKDVSGLRKEFRTTASRKI